MQLSQIILYVEDNESDVLFMHQAMKKIGLSKALQVVSDGDEAIAYLDGKGKYADRRKYPFPSLIFLDLTLPVVTGFGVLQWIRKQHSMLALPVVILSGSRMEFDLNHAYKLGANAYLIKPSNGEDLDNVLGTTAKYWLSLNQQLQAPQSDERGGSNHDEPSRRQVIPLAKSLLVLAQKSLEVTGFQPSGI
ncbi:response regulator [Pedosphaera parvula]|uniref:Response regulator receiver protein n=1 Tax=Pedosphaera parvula (strain Ellin514) TaxID=320771 RepID=B9XB96_PEDPL|nr:response regulator [Pedosphaera parvula]EEF62781.1 response regulator receiver protein [Pedosphaera parvula Ellin514]